MTATPPGWPADLPGPGAGLAEQVTGWLLDRLPPEYRTSSLRRYPLVLAMSARLHAQATLAGTRDVYRDLRAVTLENGLRVYLLPVKNSPATR